MSRQREYFIIGAVLLVSVATTIGAQVNGGSTQLINGTYYVGSANGMYAHIADAVAAIGTSRSGTIILTEGYTDVITSTLNVGHLYGPGIKVFMMPGSTIAENITDGGPGIKILEGSSLECLGATASGSVNGVLSTCQVITGGSSVSMASMVTSGALDMGREQDVFGLQGITFEPGNATVTAVGDFEGLVTPSLIANNNFFGGPNVTYVWHIGHGTAGGQMFVNNEVRGDSVVTGALVYISGGEEGLWEPTGPVIEGGEISCRGSGAQSIKIDGDPTDSGQVGVIDAIFNHVWSQDCSAAASSPYISIHNASHVTFRDFPFSISLGTSPVIAVTENAPGQTNFIVFDNDEVICQTVNCSGQTKWISDTTAGGHTHTLPPVTVNRQRYGYFTLIQHDQAGNWPSNSVLTTGTNVNTTIQTDTNLLVTQSGSAGSTSYQDASAGYAWRVQNGGAINMDFGANEYGDSWIESYQNGTTIGKPLNINTKYGGYINFGGDVFGPNFTFGNGNLTNLLVTQSGAAGSASYHDASAGYAWRVQNGGAINLDFGANDYASSWIESYQNGTTTGKQLNINTRYGGFTAFGGRVFAPSFELPNGYQVPAMPPTSAVENHVACILSPGPPIVLGHCTTGLSGDGSCACM